MLLGRSCGQWQGHWLRAPGRGGEQRCGGFLSPESSNLETKHDQATAAAAVAIASRGIADGPTRVVVGSVMRAAIAGHRADERGINGKLRAVPKRQAVADDLDAPRIVDRHINVHGG